MSHINKIDLQLTQLIINTPNLKNDKKEVFVGGLNENISYIKKNPLRINVNKDKTNFSLKTIADSNSEFDLQYLKRIQNTPFFVSYLCNNDIAVKILDFYDWRENNSFYRLFIIKKINYKSSSKSININFNFDSEFKQISKNQVRINEVILQISEESKINKNKLTLELLITSDIVLCGFNINFNTDNILSITLDNIVQKFYELESICRINHISNYFITKNQKAENELDELWNQQKYILPDFCLNKDLIESDSLLDIDKYWIDDFCNYFNLKNELKFVINNKNKNSPELFKEIPSKSTILKIYKDFEFQNKEIAKYIQKWWDLYSFPLFDIVLRNKCISEPEEVFAVYLLAIRLHLPWAYILYDKIISILEDESLSQLHQFLLLLTFWYKRIIKNTNKYGNNSYIPGYLWDNNYKSINNEIEISRFSKNVYLKLFLKNDNHIKINKLCEIRYEEKDNKINIFPSLSNSISDIKLQNVLSIKIYEFNIDLPLIWENGFFEFNNLRFKWILKKNRFQITIHCKEVTQICINSENIKISPNKKTIHYVEIKQLIPEINIGLYNKKGGTKFSLNKSQQDLALVSGFAFTKYGMITNKILYSLDQRKHLLLDKKNKFENGYEIQLRKKVDQIKFFSKYTTSSTEIPCIKNEFIDRVLNLNAFARNRLLLVLDYEFRNSIQEILSFFENNFRFLPDFIFHDKNSSIQMKSNLIIEFHFEKNLLNKEAFKFKDKNKLILKGNTYKTLLKFLEKLIKNNQN